MKKITSAIGAAAGALSVIFSFVILNYSTGHYEETFEYGGDAYTGIQNAAAGTAVNVHYLSEIVRFGFFAVLFIAGVALICHYVPLFFEEAGPGAITLTGNKSSNEKASEQKGKDSAMAGADEISKYKDLLDNGVITEEEYAAKALEIMGSKNDEASGNKAEG